MSGLNLDIPEDFLKNLTEKNFDEIAPEILEEVEPIMKSSITKSLKSVIKHEGDSELVNSVKGTKPKKTKTDAYIVNVGPSGNSKNYYYESKKHSRKYSVSNALKAIWLNYGRRGQNARPWLTKAVNSCENEIIEKMKNKWEELTKD